MGTEWAPAPQPDLTPKVERGLKGEGGMTSKTVKDMAVKRDLLRYGFPALGKQTGCDVAFVTRKGADGGLLRGIDLVFMRLEDAYRGAGAARPILMKVMEAALAGEGRCYIEVGFGAHCASRLG